GFAPNTQDPSRVHIRLSRGQQVRFTMVLGDSEIDQYLDDLVQRRKIYQELIDKNVITLTTNKEYERFTERFDANGVAAAAAGRSGGSPEAYRQKSLAIMSALNPERLFRLHVPFDGAAAAWHAALASADLGTDAGRLDAANALLPGRINLYQLSPDLGAALNKAAETARSSPANDPAFRDQAPAFLDPPTN